MPKVGWCLVLCRTKLQGKRLHRLRRVESPMSEGRTMRAHHLGRLICDSLKTVAKKAIGNNGADARNHCVANGDIINKPAGRSA